MTTPGFDDHDEQNLPAGVIRKKKRRKSTGLGLTYALLAGVSGGALLLAAPGIVGTETVSDYFKIALLAGGATLASYTVNRYAVEKGAPLFAVGDTVTGIASFAAVATIGIALWMSTFTGLVRNDVDALRLERHGVELADYIDETNRSVGDGALAAQAVRAVVADLGAKKKCEDGNSCVSNRGSGGRGKVYNALDVQHQSAKSIGDEVAALAVSREATLQELQDLMDDYRGQQGNPELSAKDRRTALQAISAKIVQKATALSETNPALLVDSFADTLRRGIEIVGLAEATEAVNAILNSHAETLSSVALDGKAAPSAPSYPAKNGVSGTLSYVGHFLPIALVVAAIDLGLPVFLFMIAYGGLAYGAYRSNPAAHHDAAEEKLREDELEQVMAFGRVPLGGAIEPVKKSSVAKRRRPNGRAS